MIDLDWNRIRSDFEMDPSLIYLNTGTAGLVPKKVFRRIGLLREQLYRNPTSEAWREPWSDIGRSRQRLSQQLGTNPDRLIFFTNISQAINTFCSSVNLPPGSQILMTDHEYGAMHMAWSRVAQRRKWQIGIARVPAHAEDPQPTIDAIASQCSSQTKLIYLSHILYSTGHILPVAEIVRLAKTKGIPVFIDGAHAPGMIPLDLGNLGAQFYAANLHKWFCAPLGTAFLYVEKGCERHLEPWQVSWAYGDDRSQPDEPNAFGSTPWIRQFEMEGTRDLTPWRVIHGCCDFHESIPHATRLLRIQELSDRVRAAVIDAVGFRCATPSNPELRGGLTSFIVPASLDGTALRQRLLDHHRIEVNLVELDGIQYLRVSTHVYNTHQEIECLARAIRKEV